jgi:hypothetical protein
MDRDGCIHAALYDASAPGAGQRLGLLDYLAAQRIRIDDTVAAHREVGSPSPPPSSGSAAVENA